MCAGQNHYPGHSNQSTPTGRCAHRARPSRSAGCRRRRGLLTEPGLCGEQVAAAIGVIERQLSRVFAADSTSIPRHILSRRLHLAYSMLSDSAGCQEAETVADVAAQCGFPSAMYFSHAFRQHFGYRASDIHGRLRI
jgi:AraC-like DNA-binding protein